jgi:hypothetical protein
LRAPIDKGETGRLGFLFGIAMLDAVEIKREYERIEAG